MALSDLFRPRTRPGHPFLAGAPMLVAHRGGSGLAPENTVEAFRNAVEVWDADMIELDVRVTRDGEVVVIHDPTVDRTTDGRGPVAEMTWPELRELDAGAHFTDPGGAAAHRGREVQVPRLDEVLASFPDVRLTVEIKVREAGPPTLELIRRHGAAHRVLVAAEHAAYRRDIRGYAGPWGASRSDLTPFVLLHRTPVGPLFTPRVDIFQVPERFRGMPLVTPRFVREAHRRNIPVHVWTVDDEPAMVRFLEMGVDGIQSDRPDVLARVLCRDAGRPPPRGLRE